VSTLVGTKKGCIFVPHKQRNNMSAAIDILVTEITLQNERISELENGLIQLKSQLIDGGMPECSILILSIDTLIKNQ